MSTNAETKPAAKRPRKMAREPKGGVADQTLPKRQGKAEQVLHMLQSPEGATIEQLVAMTGWLPYTTRAALSGLRKKGHSLTSEKLEGQERIYRVTAG